MKISAAERDYASRYVEGPSIYLNHRNLNYDAQSTDMRTSPTATFICQSYKVFLTPKRTSTTHPFSCLQ